MVESRKPSSAPASDNESSPIKAPAKKPTKIDKNLKLKRPVKVKGGRDSGIGGGDEDKKSRRASPSNTSHATPEPSTANQSNDPSNTPSEMTQCKYCKTSFIQSALKPHMETCLATLKKEAALKKKEGKLLASKLKKSAAIVHDEDDRASSVISTTTKAGKPVKKSKAVVTEEDVESRGGPASDEDAEGDDVTESIILPPPPVQAKKSVNAKVKKTAGKKVDASGEGIEKKGKKRKADVDFEAKVPKKVKKKEEVKIKTVKPKGPVDVERQCGVITPNGVPCARSLTCKSHSMGAKRAVPGRSQPYDHLLAAYQKKNQAKQQKAAMDANAPLEDSDDPQTGPIDSDEEVATVMTALSTWNPQPYLPNPVNISVQRRYQLERLREQLDHASSGGRRNVFKPKAKNVEVVEVEVEADGEGVVDAEADVGVDDDDDGDGRLDADADGVVDMDVVGDV